MVFKIASGVNRMVWDVYRSTTTSAEFVTAALDVTNQHHYKNRVVLNWDNFNATQVRRGSKWACKNRRILKEPSFKM